jgi:hypothetical protein
MDELHEHAKRVSDSMGPNDGQILDVPPRTQGLGGGENITWVKVTGFTTGNKRFVVKKVDQNGSPTGDAFEVRAITLPPFGSPGQIADQRNLQQCFPNFATNDPLPIVERSVWIGGTGSGVFVSGWWAWPIFTLSGCVLD